MFKKFNTIVILFFILKNYSEGAPKKRKGETSGQQPRENANYYEGGSSSSPAFTLTATTDVCEWGGCEEGFANKDTFVKHVNGHAEMSQDNKCHWRDCEREEPFQRQSHLKRHIVGHTEEKPYACEHVYQNGVRCDKRYTQLNNLEKHKQTHAAERIIYKCDFPSCAKTFKTSDSKKKHEKIHINPNHYGCPVFMCPKQEYTDPASLSNHVREKHGDHVWNFIKANKKAKKANGYGLIGIRENGTLYDMLDGDAGSSNPNREFEAGQTTYPPQGVQEHFVHPTYQHGGELQLFPTNVEHQEDHQNEDYLMQDNYPHEDVNTDLSLWH
uniref:C2H2-type domain-containing protein n=1 Tax=Meloidogyne enterolobii TaxID=390850 RepID=A0A6V7V8D5_MELEN|nr:unnamed protein product [Meloidogyne enterolobii]